MRKMVYVLENGVVETTEKGAKSWGLPYKIAFEDVKEEKAPLSEKTLANRKSVK